MKQNFIPVQKLTPTNSMEQRSSAETNSRSTSQEIIHLLWNLRVYNSFHKSPPVVPILGQMNLILTRPPYWFMIHYNIS
jgi:hypothetical protein